MNFKSKLIASFLAMAVLACTSDDSAQPDTAALIKQIESEVTSGSWRITSYVDSGQNETGDYNGFNFTFNENGTLVADNGTTIINGRWSITDDSSTSTDDSNDDTDIDFNIFFTSPPDFEELSDDWDITSSNTSKIELIDISGGNGGTDTLVFEKN